MHDRGVPEKYTILHEMYERARTQIKRGVGLNDNQWEY